VREVLYRGARSTVLRCLRHGQPVVVKFLRRAVLDVREAARFRREFELSRRISHPGVVSAGTLGSHDGALYLTMPDDGAVALRELLRHGPLPLADVLRVGLALVDALEAVHARNIVHKDLAPGNVVADLGRGLVRLIDFGIAAELSSERPALAPPQDLEGTLDCIAPEQTGRMNRDVDYRADFYGLGATLFMLLAGTAPFAGEDAAEIVYGHLALPPRPLAALRPDAPPMLRALVGKLLSKEPEDRYQSHLALRADLLHVRQDLAHAASDEAPAWRLARNDLPERFHVSGRLHGRADEVRRLSAAFEAAAAGPAQVVAVTGFSGIGKSALVQELQRSLLGHRGEMVGGKFQQFAPHAPCAAFVEALRQRVQQVLACPPGTQRAWRAALAARLGPNAALAVAAVPELGLLLDAAQPVLPLPPAEAENRFLLTMQHCWAALASAAHPLVLFVDDLQWADRASRRLLRAMALDDGLRHLLVVVAYRADEVQTGHPLLEDLAALAAAGPHVTALALGPLETGDVAALLADTLRRPVGDAALLELARLCHAKTGGNPFFLGRFLDNLQQGGLFWPDRAAARWCWSIARIRDERIADNVVALMLDQLRRLPAPARAVLTVAACLHRRFALATLAAVRGQGEDAVLRDLAPALAAGLLAPADGSYKWVSVLDAQERAGLRVELAFVHDRVQEAAYLLTPPQERPALHLRIGRLLRPGMDARSPDFAVVGHLNQGAPLMDDPAERAGLAALNARASERARDAASFDLAADHAARAVALHGDALWDDDPAAALALHAHAARMAGLKGDDAALGALLDAAGARALAPLDRARLLDVRIEASYASGRLDDTLEWGLAALRLLELEPPQPPAPEDARRLVAELRDGIGALGMDALSALPPMRAALPLQQLGVIAKMTAAAYIARPALLLPLTVLQVRLMMAHGHAPMALSAYSVAGLLAAELLGDYRFGHRLGRMSLALVERHGWRQVHAHAGFSFHAFLHHWIDPLSDTLPALLEVHRNGLEYGNLRHAGLGLYLHGCHAVLAGLPLAEADRLLEGHAATLRRIRQPVAHDYLRVLQETVRALQRPDLPGPPLERDGFSARALLADYAARADRTGTMFLHALRGMLHALAGRHAEAIADGEAAAAHFPAGRGMAMVPFSVFFTASAVLSQARQRGAPADAVGALDAALARFAPWVRAGAQLRPLECLLQAQRALAGGDPAAVRPACDAALQALRAQARPDAPGAPPSEPLLMLALVHWQRAALLDGAPDAPALRAEARAVLLRWGASAAGAVRDAPGAPPSASLAGAALDLGALMKAVQAVTAEVTLAPLLRRLLQVLQENAGAGRAAVVLRAAPHGGVAEHAAAAGDAGNAGDAGGPGDADGAPPGDAWTLQADSAAGARHPVPESLPLESAGGRLPLEMLRMVLATGRPVLQEEPARSAQWGRLPYFAARAVRSLLCLPLLRHGRVAGALYLESEAARGVFSPARIEFLELLSGNVVNALVNARLVAELHHLAATLEQRVEERTRALRDSEARTLNLLRSIPLPLTVTRRRDSTFVYANARAAALAGMPAEALVGRGPVSFYRRPEDRERMFAEYRRTGMLQDHEICLRDAEDRDVWVLFSIVPIVYDGEPADLSTIVDITGRKTAENQLRRAVSTDHLTGLHSRGHFLALAQAEFGRAEHAGLPLAALMLDVDHFKGINDRHGHAMGDVALRAVARTCAAVSRSADMVGRLGGEEFCVLMPNTTAAEAGRVAERLRIALGALRLRADGGAEVALTASLGVAQRQAGDGDTLDRLMARADAALYAAKRAGRDRVRLAEEPGG
jgi:diguanylate cyclase (GGDEF)-like protein/PAS domain S-box-containing protein